MKTIQVYRYPSGHYSLNKVGECETVTAFLLHTRSCGDFNRVMFLPKLARSTRKETREAVAWIPNGPLAMEDRANLERGAKFFSSRDGFLPGAFMELARRGEIIRTQA